MQIPAGQACGNEDYRHLNRQATAVSVHKRRFLRFMVSLVMVINKYCNFYYSHARTVGQDQKRPPEGDRYFYAVFTVCAFASAAGV